MHFLIVASMVLGEPGPLDAFRANFNSIRANVQYEFESGMVDSATISRNHFWEAGPPVLGSGSGGIIEGRWECDGAGEHHVVDVIPPVAGGGGTPTSSAGGLAFSTSPFEVLWDEELVAWHNYGNRFIDVLTTYRFPKIRTGPFFWFGPDPFPRNLKFHFASTASERRKTTWQGFPVELEIYRKEISGGWYQVEIAYDPSIGYLPRYARTVATDAGNAVVEELFMADAKPCRGGGFIPAEWYETSYPIQSFASRYPNYGPETAVSPRGGQVYLGRYRATRIEDRAGPVALDHLDGALALSTKVGPTLLRKGTATLTLTQIRSLLGRKLTDPAPQALPQIDEAELHRFDRRGSYGWVVALMGGLFAALLAATLIVFRRYRTLALLLIALTGSGCGRGGESPARLSAAFDTPCIVYDSPETEMKLSVKNVGQVPLRLFKADGGCTCRRVDLAKFPARLGPDESLTIGVRISNRPQYEPLNISFTFETDHGSIPAPALLQALMPRHHLSPESITLSGLDESGEASIDLVHRAVFRSDEDQPSTDLLAPPALSAIKLGSRGGKVAIDPELSYVDTTYRVTLKDRALGLQKATIVLQGSGGRNLVEAPVVWHRLPFLSSVPDRLFLGTRPVRAFLRCPDDEVELTKALSTPEGIKAVVSSTRELTVRLADGAPGIINGTIEVGTTAEGRPPLKIPVVRYAPQTAGK